MDAQTFADEVRADHARPIHPDDRELQFKEVLSFHASEKVLQRRFNRAGWIVGTIGAALGLAGVGAVVVLLPLKQTTVKWVEVDTSTGWVGEAAGADGCAQDVQRSRRRPFPPALHRGARGLCP